jgi:hypothetical protein
MLQIQRPHSGPSAIFVICSPRNLQWEQATCEIFNKLGS